MRADGIVVQDDTMMYQFQSTLPRGERLALISHFLSCHAFQSTLPRGERRINRKPKLASISFQSTLPRGERLGLYVHCGKKRCFNPRSHEGSDCMMYILLILLSLHHLFCECNYHYLCTTYILMLILCNSL